MKTARILVVDDKYENLYFLRALLESAGYAVDDAVNGAVALDLARRTPPDLVVADILMPVMDGFALCREWRQDPALSPIPFVFYTATYTDGRDREFALSLGADDFLVKPMEPDALLEKVAAALQNSTGEPRPPAPPPGNDETIFLQQYNESLVRKLESKMQQLEQDIAIREKVEAELRASEERFRSFVENANDIVFSLSEDGVFTYVSPNWSEILGHPPSEILGRFFGDFVHPDDVHVCPAALERAKTGAKQSGIEYRVRHLDGSWRWHVTNGVFLPGSDDRDPSFLGIARDVTAAKDAERERERLQTMLNQMQKIESVGRLAGGVAHDFNNMLQAILGHVELALAQNAANLPVEDDLLQIRKAAERSAALTRQLLAFARKQTIAPKILDANETIAGMLQILRRLIGENISLEWKPGPDLGRIKIDPSQIDQILANLCVNARDAIGGIGKVVIETSRVTVDDSHVLLFPDHFPGEYVVLSVSDNGCGMDVETLGQLFEPFFTTKEVGQGTGLGLATVYGIVKQNRGFIDVSSHVGVGSVFAIHLPLYLDGADRAEAPAPAAFSAPGKETVLLVEDEPSILAIAQAMLSKLGYHVLPAASPGAAIRLAQTYNGIIHLLVADVVMPEMNGRDLAKNVLALHPDVKRLFMSGYTADVVAHHGVLDSGVHFLEKPFTMATLSAKLREVLDS